MTTHRPTDLNNPMYAELLAKIALLEQQQKQQELDYQQRISEQEKNYQQQIDKQKQHYKQQAEQQKQQYEAQVLKLYEKINQLIEKQKRLIHQLFGQKSEQLTGKQLHLNQEAALEDLASLEQARDDFRAELTADELTKLPAIEADDSVTDNFTDNNNKASKPKFKRNRQNVIPDNLAIKTIVHEPESITCGCGCQMKKIGEDVQTKLGFIPKQFYQEQHIYPKYACKDCQRQSLTKQPNDNDTQTQNNSLIQASVPAGVIDKSIATPELLAHILISKYADHLPLYRQSLIYERSGVYLSDSTMADWVGRCGALLEPLVKRLRELLLTQPILHADETPVKILKRHGLKEDDKAGSKANNKSPTTGKLQQGYVWAYLTPQYCQSYGGFKAVIFDFAQSRGSDHPKAFLDRWQGKLICDDYNGYKFLFKPVKSDKSCKTQSEPSQGIEAQGIEIGCMAHARRKFHTLHVTGKSIISEQALDYFGRLYEVERYIDAQFEKHPEPSKQRPRVSVDVVKIRQAKAQPIADEFYQWLQEKRQGASKNSEIAKALDYSLRRWTALTRYLADGDLPIDNNWAENQMRPWALGRKNWLFAGSLKSGERAAVIMSLIQSARLNGLDPYAYLADVLKRLPTHKDRDIDELLPHVWKLQ
ncbi:MAG: IS66 family transposase [Acinetobacter sp.]